MTTNKIIPLYSFLVAFKRFSKKFPSLKQDFISLEKQLLENPKLGESLGLNLYKIRLANRDKSKGKSAGYRIITYVIDESKTQTNIYLLKIYDKSEESNILKVELAKIVKSIFG